jgi:NAD(P)-dependent dehydrogenase (short-subunit alcohol dehydrogenase family)
MTMPVTKRLSGRTALITGASRGIGAAVAKGFAREGAHVILVARTVADLEKLDDEIQAAGGTATLMPLDLGKPEQIAMVGNAVAERFKRLDILVGNAGILGALSPVALSDPKLYENVMRINFFANYHLIRTLDPLLRGSDAGRAIFVTSGAAQRTRAFWSAYAASKAALETMVGTYAEEVAYSPLKVNIVNPGIVRTGMRAEAFPGEDPMTCPEPDSIVEKFIELALPSLAETGKIFKAA